jgi:hypothetical protein
MDRRHSHRWHTGLRSQSVLLTFRDASKFDREFVPEDGLKVVWPENSKVFYWASCNVRYLGVTCHLLLSSGIDFIANQISEMDNLKKLTRTGPGTDKRARCSGEPRPAGAPDVSG